jgi:TolB-like protein
MRLANRRKGPVFVETLARRGYRLNAPVDMRVAPPAAQPRTLLGRATQVMSRPHLLGLAGLAVAVVALGAALNWAGNYRWRIGAGGKNIESLAVLPLENLSHDQEYFSDGMTDALITQLSKAGTLRVTSRTTAMRYKGTQKSLPEIARELNVDGVIEGSVLRSGNRVRIMAQLIQARTDEHLWAETYERDLGDVLRLQSEVAQAVVQQVRMQLTPAQQVRLRSAPVVDPQAYEAYLRGSSIRRSETETRIKQAQAYFEEAVRRDPRFALAYVGLAECYLDLGAYRWLAPQDAYRHGSEAIHKALQLDEGLGEAHSSLGYLNWQYSWDWRTAEKELRYAVDLYPNYVDGHIALLWYLAWSGRRDEALAEVQKIRWLDPAYPLSSFDEAGVYSSAQLQSTHRSRSEIGDHESGLVVRPLFSCCRVRGLGPTGAGRPRISAGRRLIAARLGYHCRACARLRDHG